MASRINQNQKDTLLDLMSTYYGQLFGKFSNEMGKSDKNTLWNTIATSLNENGPQKSVDQWKRVSLPNLLLKSISNYLSFLNNFAYVNFNIHRLGPISK